MFSDLLVLLGLKKQWPKYSWEEIEKHDSAENLWIVAGSDVYDVSKFLDEHPGGPGALLKRGGGCTDCTRDLQFHSARGRAEWERYQIGKVDTSSRRGRKTNAATARTAAVVATPIRTSVAESSPVPMSTAPPSTTVHVADCCCTKSGPSKATVAPKQHCAHCTCPDRPRDSDA